MSSRDFRAFLKPEGTNPEIDGPYYQLASYGQIHGSLNCEVSTLDFVMGKFCEKLLFRPIDSKKPIVLAIYNDNNGCYFVIVDGHVRKEKEKIVGGMLNFKPFQTNNFIIDCGDAQCKYWSITSKGITCIYGEQTFPETWTVDNCDQLCAFIGGELTANQLRMHAVLAEQETIKEKRREAHIERLARELGETASISVATASDLLCANNRHERLVGELKLIMNARLLFVGKQAITEILEKNN